MGTPAPAEDLQGGGPGGLFCGRQGAALFSSVYDAQHDTAIQRLARFSLSSVFLIDCVKNAEIPDRVPHGPIQGFYGRSSMASFSRTISHIISGSPALCM